MDAPFWAMGGSTVLPEGFMAVEWVQFLFLVIVPSGFLVPNFSESLTQQFLLKKGRGMPSLSGRYTNGLPNSTQTATIRKSHQSNKYYSRYPVRQYSRLREAPFLAGLISQFRTSYAHISKALVKAASSLQWFLHLRNYLATPIPVITQSSWENCTSALQRSLQFWTEPSGVMFRLFGPRWNLTSRHREPFRDVSMVIRAIEL